MNELEPNVPLVNEFVLFENAWACKSLATSETKAFRMKLRPLGVRWCEGSLDDIFGDAETVKVKGLPGPCLPLMLESDHEVYFRLEE